MVEGEDEVLRSLEGRRVFLSGSKGAPPSNSDGSLVEIRRTLPRLEQSQNGRGAWPIGQKVVVRPPPDARRAGLWQANSPLSWASGFQCKARRKEREKIKQGNYHKIQAYFRSC